MDILSFSRGMRRQGLVLFSVEEARLLIPERDRPLLNLQLHQWSRKGWVRRLKQGLYELAYPEPPVLSDLYVANRLYEPSYVSLETALSHYQILPETAAQVTSVTTKPTRRLRNPQGLFLYFTVRPRAFAGYGLIRLQGEVVRIAEPEKALADRLYAGLRRGEELDAASDRWDRGRLKRLDRKKVSFYAALFGASSAKLAERLHALIR